MYIAWYVVSEVTLSANSNLLFRDRHTVDVLYVVLVVIPIRCVPIDIIIELFILVKAMEQVHVTSVDSL